MNELRSEVLHSSPGLSIEATPARVLITSTSVTGAQAAPVQLARSLERDAVIELAAMLLAWLCNDVLNDAAKERGRMLVRGAAAWREMQARNPQAVRSMLSELRDLTGRYPDLAEIADEDPR